jgi:hypothetical protein
VVRPGGCVGVVCGAVPSRPPDDGPRAVERRARRAQPSAIAFGSFDEQILAVVATLLANAIEHVRALERDGDASPPPAPAVSQPVDAARPLTVRFFGVDGSTFLDGDHLIKRVAGRILWSLLRQHTVDARIDFTNKELRLDSTLDIPGFKDKLESRLIPLKRWPDERNAPVTIEKTGRGRFRLHVVASLQLETVER